MTKKCIAKNLDANGFENIVNRNDFDFNTKTLHEILFHIANGNTITYDFAIENMIMPGLQIKNFNRYIQQHKKLASFSISQRNRTP